MESSNKAIMMAAGMLLGTMIIGTIVYVFSGLKILPEGTDSIEIVEQMTAFNLEYEIYDKKIMYGVDVISVLNKAKSNNEKYVLGKFLSGEGYNTDYIIDIEVTLKKPLEERMVVTYIEQNRDLIVERDYMQNQGPDIIAKTIFTEPSDDYCNLIYNNRSLWNSLKLNTQTIETKVRAGTYHLLAGNHSSIIPGKYTNDMLENPSEIKALLEQAAQMSQAIKNYNDNKMIVGIPGTYGGITIDSQNTGWNKATWYPAIYDLKTRKFKCLGEQTVYSEVTGRIIKMVFEEI